ncbi:MAG: adenine phosphoribosyltransferase [Beduini sp.]|uniref:adenine phosphoribosyltransferase n=1 Tax=Beduini sp. TaxID=1922300 RepID=UPI0011CA3C2D
MDFKQYIADIQDFPIEGVLFRDVTPLMKDPKAYHEVIDQMKAYAISKEADIIAGPEARGFLFGCPVAYAMEAGFVPVRKPGKLPRETIECTYELEYGHNTLEMHKDAIKKGQKVVLIDDLLATGGTIEASCKMIEALGGIVTGICFLIELEDLKGREKLKDYDVYSILKY